VLLFLAGLDLQKKLPAVSLVHAMMMPDDLPNAD